MTLDEAICHCREIVADCTGRKCAEDHLQLAAWLEELKASRKSAGAWEEIRYFDGESGWRCEVCGEEFITYEGTVEDNGYNYCPACGARLDHIKWAEEDEECNEDEL